MSRAWADQNKSLAKIASETVSGVHISLPWWLSLFGFQQFQSRRAIVMPIFCCMTICITAIFYCVVATVGSDSDSLEGRFGSEVITVMGLCSVACLLQLNLRRPGKQSVAQATSELLMNNMMLPDYVDLWLDRSRRSSCEVVVLLFLSVAAETAVVLSKGAELDPGQAFAHLAVFATVATTFSAVSLYFSVVCSAQAAMVDHFSAKAADLSQDYEVLRHRWDQIQAILRRSAQCLTPSLMIITLSPVVVLVTSTMHFMEDSEYDAQRILLELFPKTFVLLGIIRVLSRIGEVTGNCDRLPVFLNSLLLGDGWDWEASHLIRFIERSKAGFYVFDTKVDYTVMSKVAYIFSGGLLALLAEAVQL
ncbi:unnamed protein product [Polarella glacialis]|uniref:Gustatory receptor n=1 Tax=Polarella glacialis TaxID=89957 RepID=A0A813LSX3_POLGL|nr:unnamed protein product [Polarella glacialis]